MEKKSKKKTKKTRQILHIEIKMFLRQCLARKTVNVPGSVIKNVLHLAFFYSFWNLADYSKQNAFLRGSIKKSLPARVLPTDGSRKAKTVIFSYFVPDGKEDKRVCRDYFKSVLKLGFMDALTKRRRLVCWMGEESPQLITKLMIVT